MAEDVRRIVAEFTARNKAAGETAAFNRQLNTTRQTVMRLGRSMLVMAGVGGGIYALKRGFEAVVRAASDAEEIGSKFDVVFRDLNIQARNWAIQFGDDVGRATQDVENWMAGLQDTFVPLGIARDEAYELAKALTTLAVDVASFNNKADAEVIRDFTSALVGNHETVRKFGIIISESAIKQAALNKGWNKSYKELTDLEKVMLRFQLIQEGTTDAQGDAIRTGDSYANQIKRLRANFSELSVTIGNELVPALADMAKGLNSIFSRTDEFKAKLADLFASYMELNTIHDKLNKVTGWAGIRVTPNIEGVKTFAEAAEKYRKIAKDIRMEKYYTEVGPDFFKPKTKPELPGTEGAAALTAEQMKNIVKSTREAMESVRHQDYLTRMERIQSLQIYAAQNADTLAQVADANKILNDEILSLERSRLDAMKVYNAELREDMQNQGLYISERFADTAQSIEGSMSGAFESMIADGATFRDAMSQFFADVGRSFARMAADMAARAMMANIMGSFFGGGGGGFNAGTTGTDLGSTQSATSVPMPHSGGIIGVDSFPTRVVPSAVFANAPRLHEGLRSNERAAILEVGEEVRSKEDVRRGEGGAVVNNYFNIKELKALDSQDVQRALYKERKFLNDLSLMGKKSNHPDRRYDG